MSSARIQISSIPKSFLIARLAELAQEANVECKKSLERIPLVETQQYVVTSQQDYLEAQRLLGRVAGTGLPAKIVRRRSMRNRPLQNENIEAALSHLVQHNGSAGVAQCLLNEFENLTLMPQSRKSPPDHVKLPAGLLKQAAVHGNFDLVHTLARVTSEAEASAALAAILQTRDKNMQNLLFYHGADPNLLRDFMIDAVISGDMRVLRILLRAPKRLNEATFEGCLKAAIDSRNLRALNLLLRVPEARFGHLQDGERLNWNRNKILSFAIRSAQYIMVITIAWITSRYPLSDLSLFNLVATVDFHRQTLRKKMVETLLCLQYAESNDDSKSGKPTTLYPVQHGLKWNELLQGHGVSTVTYVPHSFSSGIKITSFQFLSESNLWDGEMLWRTTDTLSEFDRSQARSRLLPTLLESNESGVWIGDGLCHAVRTRNSEAALRILARRAQINILHIESASCAAMENEDITILRELLAVFPCSQYLVNALFPKLQNASPKNRLELTQVLLKEGVPRKLITPYLNRLLRDYTDQRDPKLIKTLIGTQASCSAVSLAAVIDHADLKVLQALVDVHTLIRPVYLLHQPVPLFVDGDLKFLADRLAHLQEPKLRHLCLRILEVHLRTQESFQLAFQNEKYRNLREAFRIGPIDAQLIRLFDLHQEILPRAVHREIMCQILFSRELYVSTTLIDHWLNSELGHADLHNSLWLDYRILILNLVGHCFSNDEEKASKVQSLCNRGWSSDRARDLCVESLEMHLRTLVRDLPEGVKWPIATIKALMIDSISLDNHFYSCLRITAMHEQVEPLEFLLSKIPRAMMIGGDLLRPLIRYRKVKSLKTMLKSRISAELALRALETSRTETILDIEIGAALLAKIAEFSANEIKPGLHKVLSPAFRSILVAILSRGAFKSVERNQLWQKLVQPLHPCKKHDIATILLRQGVSKQLVEETFLEAVRRGDMWLCKSILKYDPEEQRDATHSMPLSKLDKKRACECAHTDLRATCIADDILHQALNIAISSANVQVCRLLLDHGAHVVHHGNCLLKKVVLCGSASIMKDVLAHTPASILQDRIDRSLVFATVYNKLAACKYLVARGASPLAFDCGALQCAANRARLEILESFLASNIPSTALMKAFQSSQTTVCRHSVTSSQRQGVIRLLIDAGMSDRNLISEALLHLTLEKDPSDALIQLLLEKGAFISYKAGECLTESWRRSHFGLIKLLCARIDNTATAAHVFTQACNDYFWRTLPEGEMLGVIRQLLDIGVPKALKDAELATALKTSASNPQALALVRLLIKKGGELKDASDENVYLACLSGDEILSQEVFRHKPPVDVRLNALARLASTPSEGVTRDKRCLDLLLTDDIHDTGLKNESILEIIRLILANFKQPALLQHFLVEHKEVNRLMRQLGVSEPHKLRELIHWAIISDPKIVTSNCIVELLEVIFREIEEQDDGPSMFASFLEVEPCLWPSQSDSAPLILLALNYNRPELVSSIVTTDKAPRDGQQVCRLALSVAARRGHTVAATKLIPHATTRDDGSLHTAVCEQNHALIRLLVETGHSPAHRSPMHENLTPLECLLRLDNPLTELNTLSVTINTLLLHNTDPSVWTAWPSHLSVALQSKHPAAVTRSLLDSAPHANLYANHLHFRDGLNYSALSLVEKDLCPHLKLHEKGQLIQYLEAKGYGRTYYALEGPQPVDAVGVPDIILEREDDRLRRLAFGAKDCAVCLEKASNDNNIHAHLTSACKAKHSWSDEIICSSCLTAHITSQIYPDGIDKVAVNDPRCWAQSCSTVLSHSEVRKYISPALFAQYDDRLTLQSLHADKNSARCANTRIACRGGAWFSADDLQNIDSFRCPVCRELTCLQCNSVYNHGGQPCPAGLAQQRKQEEAASAREVRRVSKECECGAWIMKNRGCDHMTCTKCLSEWCWECQVPYEIIRAQDNSAHRPTCKHYRPRRMDRAGLDIRLVI